jgi:hypothetical protein
MRKLGKLLKIEKGEVNKKDRGKYYNENNEK